MAGLGGDDGRTGGRVCWKNGSFRWFGLLLVLVSMVGSVTTQRSAGAENGAIPLESGSPGDDMNVSTAGYDDERFQVASFDWDRVQTPMIIGLMLLACALTKLVFHFHHKLSSLCPESCLLILIGIVIGIILYAANIRDFTVNAHLFFFYMVPPIILDAGFFIPNRTFFDNIGTILLYAIFGTILNTLLLGFSLWGVSFTSTIPFRLDVMQSLTFAALMSAVDPMSVLAIFDDAHVTECLYIIVFGESLVNNGIAVVLYHIFVGLTDVGSEDVLNVDILNAVGSFVLLTTVSILLGIMFGVIAVLLTRVSDHVPVVQPLFVLVFGYIAYIFAEMFHMSGILACALCGMTMKKYVKANMSKKSHTTTRYFLKLLASIGETVIFIYLGVLTVISVHQWNSGFCLLTLLFCVVLRTAVLLMLTVMLNWGRLPKLTLIDQFILSYGGLRGAIAFSLLLSLDDDLFPMKKMYFTAAVLTIFFTNFFMGSTIKPLVKILKGKRSTALKSSLNDQIQERLIDHLMAGIEDIAGHHGHHRLRDKFEYLDKHYLQKAFVRQSRVTKNGWNAVSNYDKLSVKEARELEQTTDYSSMLRQLQPENGMIRNFSFMRWLSSVSHGCFPYGYPPFTMSGMKVNDQAEQTLVDLQAMEAQNTRKMRDDSKVHHIIEDSMFVPRKRFLGHPRHTVPPDSYSHVQLHHKARLHLRHLMSHHHRHVDSNHHNCNSAMRNNSHNNKPKKNVSFAEVAQVTKVCDLCTPLLTKQISQESKDDGETDLGSTRAESGLSGEETDSDIGGITFTAVSLEEIDTQSDIPVEPVAVEMSLPWKRNTGRDPMPSAMKHSMPDDHNPLIGEAPSWVANTEYTSPGSPPVTPQSQHQTLSQTVPSQTSSERDQMMSEGALDAADSADVNKEEDLIQFTTPDHKPAMPHNRDIRDEEENDNHERTANSQVAGTEASHDNEDLLLSDLSGAVPQEVIQSEPAMTKSCPFKEKDPLSTPLSQQCDDQMAKPLTTTKPIDIQAAASMPWRSDVQSQSAPVCSAVQVPLPWRQNSYNGDSHPLPWREINAKDTDYRLPWRQSSLDSADENRNDKDNGSDCGLPPPWLDNKASPISAKDKGDCVSQTSKLPWRDNSNVEVKLDQCAPRPRHVPSPPEEEEVSHIPPPPWRHNPEPDCSVRSPSASCEVDLYSLRPQLSSHSFRISEAESKHSEPVHVHHMIEVPQPRPHIEFDCESSHSLDLESEEVTLNDRIARWLDTCDPQPLEDDLEDMPIVTSAQDIGTQRLSCGSVAITGDLRKINREQAESVV